MANLVSFTMTNAGSGNILFTDTSTASNITAWSWHIAPFPSGTQQNSTLQNPTLNIPYGIVDITLGITTTTGGSTTFYYTIYRVHIISGVPSVATTPSFTYSLTGTTLVTTDTSTGTPPIKIIGYPPGTYTLSTGWHDISMSYYTSLTDYTGYYYLGEYHLPVFVAGGPSVVAAFTHTPDPQVPSSNVTFTDTSTGSPNNWNWDFGDGNTSTSRNPTHSYAAIGTY